jgi:uncharacterized RDD family membrane protein YckC
MADGKDGLRSIMTPEGVPLTVRLASRGDRAGAVTIDLVILFLSIGLIAILLFAALAKTKAIGFFVVFLLASFFIRSFYFIFFELRWNGVTPGKKLMKIRVTDRDGGPLRAEAVFARNLMREVELFLPASFLGAVPTDAADAWTTLLIWVWMGVFVLMPLFNRDRLRIGDMVGGTMVIEAPSATLAEDISRRRKPAPGGIAVGYAFTPRELGVYGIHELQTLEDVLRRGDRTVMAEVARRIARKIGRPEADAANGAAFLEAYYTALRGTLESKALFGIRRRDKYDTSDPSRTPGQSR